MMWFALYFALFTLINGGSIQIENIKQDNTFDLHKIQELYFRLKESKILRNISVQETNSKRVLIYRNKMKQSIQNVLSTFDVIGKQLALGIYLYVESILNTYNGITFAYFTMYNDELNKNKTWSAKAIEKVLFQITKPNDAIHRDSLFTLINASNLEVKPLIDHFLVFSSRSKNYCKSKGTLRQLLNDIKRHNYNIFTETVEYTPNFDDSLMIEKLVKFETKLVNLLDVFSDFYRAYLLKHSFHSQSFTEIKALKMFIYNELKCDVKIKSLKDDPSELKILEKWICEPDLEARNFGFIMSRRNKLGTLEPFSFIKYEKSIEKTFKVKNVIGPLISLVNKIESKQTDKKIMESLGEKSNEMIRDDFYDYKHFNMSLKELDDWITFNFNTNNLLTLNYITVELMIQTVGLISSRLLYGAEYFLYKYCLMIVNVDHVSKNVENIKILRTYLIVFRSLLKKLKSLSNYITIVVKNNTYLKRMENNLTKMVDLILINRYKEKYDHLKIHQMKIALLYDHGKIYVNDTKIDDWKIKQNYILSPIILLSKAIDLLFAIQFQNRII